MAEEENKNTKEVKIDKDMLTKFIKNRGVTITNEDDESFYTGTIMIRDKKTTVLKLGGGFFNINIKFGEPNKRQIQKNKGAVPLIEFGPAEKKEEEKKTTTTTNKEDSNTTKYRYGDDNGSEEITNNSEDDTNYTTSENETNPYAEKAKEIKMYMDITLYSIDSNKIIYTEEPLKLTSEDKDNIYIDLYATCITDNLISLTYNITFDPVDLTKKEEEEKEKKKKERQEKNKAKEEDDNEPEDDD